jgi:hypothetical protein
VTAAGLVNPTHGRFEDILKGAKPELRAICAAARRATVSRHGDAVEVAGCAPLSATLERRPRAAAAGGAAPPDPECGGHTCRLRVLAEAVADP